MFGGDDHKVQKQYASCLHTILVRPWGFFVHKELASVKFSIFKV